jgi:hypothetical protein
VVHPGNRLLLHRAVQQQQQQQPKLKIDSVTNETRSGEKLCAADSLTASLHARGKATAKTPW